MRVTVRRRSAAVCGMAALAWAAVSGAPAAAQSGGRPLPDVRVAEGWAEGLAACDVTRFLLGCPDLSAEVIALPDARTGEFRATFAPLFLPPTLYGDAEVSAAFYRLEARGDLTRRDALRARTAAARRFLPAYRTNDSRQRLFLEEQDRLCGRLLDETRAR